MVWPETGEAEAVAAAVVVVVDEFLVLTDEFSSSRLLFVLIFECCLNNDLWVLGEGEGGGNEFLDNWREVLSLLLSLLAVVVVVELESPTMLKNFCFM